MTTQTCFTVPAPAQEYINAVADKLRHAHHQPLAPSYAALVRETITQYQELIRSGLRVIQRDASIVANQSTVDLFSCLREGFAYVPDSDPTFYPDHPLQNMYGGLSLYRIFRLVHDVNGHYASDNPFETFEGEWNAYVEQSMSYSTAALPALFAEIMGSVCHYYAGHGFPRALKSAPIAPMVPPSRSFRTVLKPFASLSLAYAELELHGPGCALIYGSDNKVCAVELSNEGRKH